LVDNCRRWELALLLRAKLGLPEHYEIRFDGSDDRPLPSIKHPIEGDNFVDFAHATLWRAAKICIRCPLI
jgi:hypothetical protein